MPATPSPTRRKFSPPANRVAIKRMVGLLNSVPNGMTEGTDMPIPFAAMSAAKIRMLRELLHAAFHHALVTATEHDNQGRTMLAVKFGGRACGIEHAIELLDMVESQPIQA